MLFRSVQKLLREQGAPGLARSARERDPAPAPGESEAGAPVLDIGAELAGGGAEHFAVDPKPARVEPRPAAAPDLTSLRSILAGLREAERILAQARAS